MQTLRSIVELLYFLSGIGLLVIGWKGLKQLGVGIQQVMVGLEQVAVAKQDIEIRSQREAALLAVNQSDTFCNDILPFYENLLVSYKNKSISRYSGEIINFNSNEEDVIKYMKDFQRECKKAFLHNDLIGFLQSNVLLANKLENLAIYFVKGIADEKIVRDSLSSGYRNIVKLLYPHLCQSITKNPSLYSNLRELYNIWEAKDKESKLTKQSEVIAAELLKIHKKNIFPIGTNNN